MATEPEAADKLAGAVKTLRQSAGITQEELAERAGISTRTVSDVERGLRTVVHRDTANRLASALGLSDAQQRDFDALARGRKVSPARVPSGGGLPMTMTPFFGRSHELGSLSAILRGSDVRILTLTGPGGIGKTRLAMEVARRTEESFADGVFFVSLGELTDASLVAPEIAKAIAVVEQGGNLDKLIATFLAERNALVVLDTFEHLIPAATLVYALLLACPTTKFLVTSRSALRLRGENEFPLPPLEFPPASVNVTPEEVARWPATALFWARAHAVRPDIELDQEAAALVVDICRNLDGLPLAIELAAARIKHLPLAAIRGLLEDRLRLLVGGPVDLPLRQRAIGSTVAWSHDLLGTSEAALFRRLSVFSGGWDLAAADAICGATDEPGDALEGMSALVDQSLVTLDRGNRGARYEMAGVVREFAAQRLVEAHETDEIARRHAWHYLALAEEAGPSLVRSEHQETFRLLDVERGNLRRAMAWTLHRGETSLGLRFSAALWRYWRQLGEFAEGRRWSEAMVANSEGAPASLRAKGLLAVSALAFPQGDYERMAELASEVTELAGQTDDPVDLRNALAMRGMVAMFEGRYGDAVEPFREGLLICRQMGPGWELATSHLNLGLALLHAGDPEAADGTFQDGLRMYRGLGDDIFAARITNASAQAALASQDIERSDTLARQTLSVFAGHGERQGIADSLEILAAVAAAGSHLERASTLAGAASSIRETIASHPAPFEMAVIKRFTGPAEKTAGENLWRKAWEAGRALNAEAAVRYALTEPLLSHG